MSGTTRLGATPPGITLCALDDIADGAARNFVVELRAGRFFGFVVRRGTSAFGYVDRCPHMGLPLAQTLDAYLTPDKSHIVCSWHGAMFGVPDGRCLGGPCGGQALVPWPVAAADNRIVTLGDASV